MWPHFGVIIFKTFSNNRVGYLVMGLQLNSCHLHADENDDAVTRGWKRFGYQRAQSYYPSGEKNSGSSLKMKMVNDTIVLQT